jgi:hypothetical protein
MLVLNSSAASGLEVCSATPVRCLGLHIGLTVLMGAQLDRGETLIRSTAAGGVWLACTLSNMLLLLLLLQLLLLL